MTEEVEVRPKEKLTGLGRDLNGQSIPWRKRVRLFGAAGRCLSWVSGQRGRWVLAPGRARAGWLPDPCGGQEGGGGKDWRSGVGVRVAVQRGRGGTHLAFCFF